jgi:outer membrane protein OmpA-like peptidoglycan-associated protein
MRKFFYIFTLLLLPSALAAQENPKIKKKEFLTSDAGKKEAWKGVKKGDKYYKKGDYDRAVENYSSAVDYNEMYAPLLYKAGVSESFAGMHDLALRHLTDAYDFSSGVAFDCQYWVGVAKQHLNRFADAKSDFDDCAAGLDEKQKKKLQNKILLRITQCDLGAGLKKVPYKAVSQIVPGGINTEKHETAPVFCNLDSSLYYGFQGDVYYAKAVEGKFNSPAGARGLNSKSKNDYPANMNLNGKEIFTCRKDKKIFHFYKKSENSQFKGLGKIMKKTVSVSFSKDSSSVLVCMKKGEGLIGGYDVFLVKKKKGKYQKPQNLGEQINSAYDEVFAAFGNNDTVIYFASNGQKSVGEFDILKASYRSGKVSRVENLGLGINSGTDDCYFQLSPGEERIGYYSSKQKGGKGGYDIYKVLLLYKPQIQLPPLPHYELAADWMKEPPLPLEDPQIIKTMRLTVVKGKITDYDGENCLDAKIIVTDNSTSLTAQQITVDKDKCEYTVMLPSGKNYAFTVTSDGYFFHSENFDIPKTSDYQEIEKDIRLLPMDPGSKVVLNNVFFDTGKSDLREESFGELNRLAEIFKLYPNIVIEVSGHTDNLGNRQYNVQLSQKRAEAVRDYIISQGVDGGRIVAKGYGPDQPRDTNATPEGRQNNRRVEAKILSN